MKETKIIKIEGDESFILSTKLEDVLGCIVDGDKYAWALLWLEATGELADNVSMLEFERKINEADYGKPMTWKELEELSTRFSQIINLLLIGDKQSSNIRRYASDDQMYLACSYIIELIDSSYWIIHSNEITTLDRMKERLDGVTFINE